MGPEFIHDFTIAMDYGCFVICGGQSGANYDLLDTVVSGDGVAADGDCVLVLSPHQNNFAMPLRVEVWGQEPPDDLDDWQEAFEAGLEIGPESKLVVSSPTLRARSCPVPSGRYLVRLVGKGFVARGWPGSTKPPDQWRVQLWPAPPEPVQAVRLRRWS